LEPRSFLKQLVCTLVTAKLNNITRSQEVLNTQIWPSISLDMSTLSRWKLTDYESKTSRSSRSSKTLDTGSHTDILFVFNSSIKISFIQFYLRNVREASVSFEDYAFLSTKFELLQVEEKALATKKWPNSLLWVRCQKILLKYLSFFVFFFFFQYTSL